MIIILGISILGIVSYKQNTAFKDTSDRITHTHEVLFESKYVLSTIKDLRIATRGYELTTDSSFIAKVLKAKDLVLRHVDTLQLLTSDNPGQQVRINRLKELIIQRTVLSLKAVAQRRNKAFTPLTNLNTTYDGEKLMNQIREVVDEIQREENRLLVLRNRANTKNERVLRLSFFLLLFVAALFIVLSFFSTKRYLLYRRKAEEAIALMNASLEKRVEQKTNEIFEKEKRYQLVVDNMLEGIQIIDFDWKYVYVNNALVKQRRYLSHNLLGFTMMDCYPGIENTDLFQVLKMCMQERVAKQLENEFIYPDGTKGYYALSIQPVPEGLFILSMDVSDRKEREAEKERYIKELEEVLFKISHEVRHPVVQILGVSELIEQSLLSAEELPDVMESMKESAQLLDIYTRDLTGFVVKMKNDNLSIQISDTESMASL